MASFHSYPSQQQSIAVYSRNEPLHCDVVEFDTTGCFVPWVAGNYQTGCFVAAQACIVEFHACVLISSPSPNSCVNVWLMKNNLPTVPGQVGGEIAGDDVPVFQPSTTTLYNVSARITRKMKLQAGDRVWAVPGINAGGQTVPAVAVNGFNTVNYFEGVILETI